MTINQSLKESLRYIISDPKWITEELNKSIIGQTAAKKVLAVAVLQRSVRLLLKNNELKINKSNVLLIGNTGTGKTELIKTLAEILEIPLIVFDVSTVTSAGYHGNDTQDILKEYLLKCDSMLKTGKNADLVKGLSGIDYRNALLLYAETGIIYLDEFDKCRKSATNGRDINGQAVQQELLKLLETGEVFFSSYHKETQPPAGITSMKTDNLFVICGGAFVGLKEIVNRRLNKQNGIGFIGELVQEYESSKVLIEDLVEYGIIPELIGRIHSITHTEDLGQEDLEKIICTAKNSVLEQAKKVFGVFGIELNVTKSAVKEIAKEAKKLGTGARALSSLFNKVLIPDVYNIYDLPTTKPLKITKELVRRRL